MNINVQADKEVDVVADQQSVLNKVNPHDGPTLFSEERRQAEGEVFRNKCM